jgi:hypothetical protein
MDEIRGSAHRALESPAAERNKGPILDVLRRVLPPTGLVLEIASGTGQHVVHFARGLPGLSWQPSDPDAAMRESLRAHIAASACANIDSPIELDVSTPSWSISRADAVVAINMIHIAPWAATEGMLRGAGRLLGVGTPLVLYGPFKREGRHTAPSNEAFDASLRQRDPQWGVRELETVADLARNEGFALQEVVEMPANNLIVVFARSQPNHD